MIPVKEVVLVVIVIVLGWACVRIFHVYRFFYCNDYTETPYMIWEEGYIGKFYGYKWRDGSVHQLPEPDSEK